MTLQEGIGNGIVVEASDEDKAGFVELTFYINGERQLKLNQETYANFADFMKNLWAIRPPIDC